MQPVFQSSIFLYCLKLELSTPIIFYNMDHKWEIRIRPKMRFANQLQNLKFKFRIRFKYQNQGDY